MEFWSVPGKEKLFVRVFRSRTCWTPFDSVDFFIVLKIINELRRIDFPNLKQQQNATVNREREKVKCTRDKR
jgi:hypothetical protein